MSGRYPSFFGGVQVPELDVAVSRGDEVAAVLGEGDGEHAARHFVGGDDGAFLKSKRTAAVTNVTSSQPQSQRVTGEDSYTLHSSTLPSGGCFGS